MYTLSKLIVSHESWDILSTAELSAKTNVCYPPGRTCSSTRPPYSQVFKPYAKILSLNKFSDLISNQLAHSGALYMFTSFVTRRSLTPGAGMQFYALRVRKLICKLLVSRDVLLCRRRVGNTATRHIFWHLHPSIFRCESIGSC